MKTTRLMLTSVLALALLGSAACSTSEDSSGSAIGDPAQGSDPAKPEDPSAGGNAGGNAGGSTVGGGGNTQPEPPAQGGDDVTIESVIEGMAPTARINYQVVEDACGDSQECLDHLAKLQDYFENCADCSPVLANFNNSVSNSQLSSGNLPTTLPQAKDVSSVLDEALNSDASDTGADAGNAEPSVDTAVDEVVDELNKMGIEETDWTGIVNLVDEDARADFEETVKDALANSDDPTAEALLNGEPVAATDAAEAIENATK